MNEKDLVRSVFSLLDSATERGRLLGLAESLTGGLLAKYFVDIPGASAYFWGGIVSYSRQSKEALLKVSAQLIDEHGMVSGETALAMAKGVLDLGGAYYALALTGEAGPKVDKGELGRVFIATADRQGRQLSLAYSFRGSRSHIRKKACIAGLHQLINFIKGA